MGSPYRARIVVLGVGLIIAAGAAAFAASARPETAYIAAVATVGALLALVAFLRARPQLRGIWRRDDRVTTWVVRVEVTNTSSQPVRLDRAFLAATKGAKTGIEGWVPLMSAADVRVPPFTIEPYRMVELATRWPQEREGPQWLIVIGALDERITVRLEERPK